MPVDLTSNKDVSKEGDKPQAHVDAAEQARLKLSREAAAHKPEAAAKPAAATDTGIMSYLSARVDDAASLVKSAATYLPSFGLTESAPAKKPENVRTSTSKLDVSAFTKATCEDDSKVCKPADVTLPQIKLGDTKPVMAAAAGQMSVAAEKPSLVLKLRDSDNAPTKLPDVNGEKVKVVEEASNFGKFKFNTDKVDEMKDNGTGKMQSEAERTLSKKDWELVAKALEARKQSQGNPFIDITRGWMHADKSGRTDVIKQDGSTALIGTNGEVVVADAAGNKVVLDKNGNPFVSMSREGAILKLDGNKSVVVALDGTAIFKDASGKPIGSMFVLKDGTVRAMADFEAAKVVTNNVEIKTTADLMKQAEIMQAEAKKSGKAQQLNFENGMLIVGVDGSKLAIQKDGEEAKSVVISATGDVLEMSAQGQLTVQQKGKAKRIISAEELNRLMTEKSHEMASMSKMIEQLMNFRRTSKLVSEDGRSSLTVAEQTITGKVDNAQTVKDGSTTTVSDGKGNVQTVDNDANTVAMKGPEGDTTVFHGKPDGKIAFDGPGYKYDSGKVTTDGGNEITADHVRMSNGTEYNNDGSVNFADGSKITAEGIYRASNGRGDISSSKALAIATAESQAASVASYAEGMAGALRSKAASGNATASDIASLESVFSSLCAAVTALSSECSPGTQFKLYSAKSSIGDSISTGRANLNTRQVAA